MKYLLFMLLPLVAADYFKETQNFQYSRSGDGEGDKKGFYASQTGNMGGNYEKSRNMDTLAQRQMKGLVMAVGSQLGIDPHRIGTGEAAEDLGAGSVFGSASSQGTAFGVAGSDSERLGLGGAGRYGSESRRMGGESFGTQQREYSSNYGSRTSGQQAAGSTYEEGQARHGSGSGLSSQSGYRQTGGRQVGSSGSHYRTGSSQYNTNLNEYETANSHLGETGAISTADQQTEGSYYVPVTGVRQVGVESANAGSLYAGSGSTYHTETSGYEDSHSFSKADSQRRVGEAVTRPVVVRPGSTVRLSVAPNTVVPLRIPVTARVPARPGYTQQNAEYGSSRVRGENVDSEYQHLEDDEQRRNYGTDTYAQTAGVDKSRGIAKGYESSYSYKKEWENHGTTADGGSRLHAPGLTVGPVTDMGMVAQNRDRLLLAGAEVGSDTQGSTVYNSGSRVASTGRQYGGSQTYRENNGESQQRRYQTDTRYNANRESMRHSGETYDGTAAHDLTDSEGSGSQLHQTAVTKPKSYQSSYSYQKSWEKHGTPYVIEPGMGTLESGALTNQNEHGQNSQHQDLSQREEHGSRYGSSSQNAGSSSSYRAGSQFANSHDSAYAAGSSRAGASQTDGLSVDMAGLQQRLREQMGKLCTDCNTGTGNTKGYSAHYSYSAQRSYGGEHDRDANNEQAAEHPRFRRGSYYGGYSSARHRHSEESVDQHDDLGQQTEDFGHTSEIDFHAGTDAIHEKISKLTERLKKVMEKIDDSIRKEYGEAGQISHGVSDIYSQTDPKHDVESVVLQNGHLNKHTDDFGQQTEDLGQQTEDLGQQTQGFSDVNHFYSHSYTQNHRFQVGNMKFKDDKEPEIEDLGQKTEDLGQETEDLEYPLPGHLPSYTTQSNTNLQIGGVQNTRPPKLQIGSSVYNKQHLGKETADLGQQTQGFSENYNSNTHIYNSQNIRNPKIEVGSMSYKNDHKAKETEDMGQQTEDFGREAGRYHLNGHSYGQTSKFEVGSTLYEKDSKVKETKDLDNSNTQTYNIENTRAPKIESLSMTSKKNEHIKDLGQQFEDFGQQTEDLGQQTEDLRQPTPLYLAGSYSHSQSSSNLQLGNIQHHNQNTRYPKLQVGSSTYNKDHLGQETEDLGQQTQGFSNTYNFNSPNYNHQNTRTPKLEVGNMLYKNDYKDKKNEDLGQQTEVTGQGSIGSYSQRYNNKNYGTSKLEIGSQIIQDEHTGQETEDLGQQLEELGKPDSGFSQSGYVYSHGISKLELGGAKPKAENLEQQTENLGKKYGEQSGKSQLYGQSSYLHPKLQVGTIVQNNKKTESEDQKADENIDFDETQNIDLQLGNILQQNEFFGHHSGGIKEKEIKTNPSDTNITPTYSGVKHIYALPEEEENSDAELDRGDHLSHLRGDQGYHKSASENNEYKELKTPTTEKSKLSKNKDFFDEHRPSEKQEDLDSHLAGILAALGSSNFNIDGHKAESKIENIQAKYTDINTNNKHNIQTTNYKEKASVDIEFEGIDGSSPGQETQQITGWDQQTDGHENSEQDVFRGQTKPKPLTSHSFLSTTQEVQEGIHKETEEKSFLDTISDQLDKSDKEIRTFGTSSATDTTHIQVSSDHLAKVDPEPETDDGGQQTLENQWSPDLFHQSTVEHNHNDQHANNYQSNYNQHSHGVLTLSSGNRKKEDVEDLHQQFEKENFDHLGQETEKEDFHILGQETEKENFYNLGQETQKENFAILGQKTEQENFANLNHQDEELISVTTSTAKPGFWNKVGSGLGKAKEKAKNWFG